MMKRQDVLTLAEGDWIHKEGSDPERILSVTHRGCRNCDGVAYVTCQTNIGSVTIWEGENRYSLVARGYQPFTFPTTVQWDESFDGVSR